MTALWRRRHSGATRPWDPALAREDEFVYGLRMIVFWIAAAVLSALAAALVLYRGARLARLPAGDPTLDVYRRQLSEIDDLAERGLLADEERRVARAEAARRLLGAADASTQATAPAEAGRATRLWVLAGAVAAPLVALGLYMWLGSPGLPDQPFAKRLAVWKAAADPTALPPQQLAAVVESLVKEHPTDPKLRFLLGRVQAASGNLPGAIQSLQTATRLAPGEAEIWTTLGNALLQQGQGQETPQAVAAYQKAAQIDPSAVDARYNLARARILGGDLQGGLGDMRALQPLMAGPEQRQALDQVIDASQKAGRLVENLPDQQQAQVQPQTPGPGPSQDQVQAAQQAQAGAAPSDQKAFIQSMVDGLAAKLKANPQDLRSWALLIHSYGVLNEPDKQAAAYAEASKRFKGDAAAMQALDAAKSGQTGGQ